MRCNRLKLTIITTLITLSAAASALAAGPGARAGASGSVEIQARGLPRGEAPQIVVRGPRVRREIGASQTLTGLRPGRYTLSVGEVTLSRGAKGVPAGAVALPAKRRVSVVVRAGHRSRVRVRYTTIIKPHVRRLPVAPLGVHGDAQNPSRIVLSPSTDVRPGVIFAAAPSPQLPRGLFHRVIAVHRARGRLVVTLKPARLSDAFVKLDINEPLRQSQIDTDGARTTQFDPVVVSYNAEKWSCQTPARPAGVNIQFSFQPSIDVDLDYLRGTGHLAINLNGTAIIATQLPKDLQCNIKSTLPPLVGVMPVGLIPVPIYAEVGGQAALAVDADVDATATMRLTYRLGFAYDNHKVSDMSGFTAADIQVTGKGGARISVGPTLRLAVGVPQIIDMHLDTQPQLIFSLTDQGCTLRVDAGLQVGILGGPFEVNQPIPIAPWYLPSETCPPPERLPVQPAPTPPPPPKPSLTITQRAPATVDAGQQVDFEFKVSNEGADTARDVVVYEHPPYSGEFVESEPASQPGPGGSLQLNLGDLQPGEAKSGLVRWQAPLRRGSLENNMQVRSRNLEGSFAQLAQVEIMNAPFAGGDLFITHEHPSGEGPRYIEVQQRGPGGELVRTLTAGSNHLWDTALDSEDNLYAPDWDTDRIYKFDSTGTPLGQFGGPYRPCPTSIVFDADGNYYVGYCTATDTTEVGLQKFGSDGDLLASYHIPDWNGGGQFDIGADRCTLLYSGLGSQAGNVGRVKRYDLCTDKALSDFAVIPDTWWVGNVVFLPDGGILTNDNDVIYRFNSSGQVVDTYDLPGDNDWHALAIGPPGLFGRPTFWATDAEAHTTNGDNVVQFDMALGRIGGFKTGGDYTSTEGWDLGLSTRPWWTYASYVDASIDSGSGTRAAGEDASTASSDPARSTDPYDKPRRTVRRDGSAPTQHRARAGRRASSSTARAAARDAARSPSAAPVVPPGS